jgi:hypothetical protein
MTTKTKATAPAVKVSVSPLESVFEVTLPSSEGLWFEDYYKFTIASDGTVTINDNEFSTKKQAAQALKAMADFLSK